MCLYLCASAFSSIFVLFYPFFLNERQTLINCVVILIKCTELKSDDSIDFRGIGRQIESECAFDVKALSIIEQ